MTTVLSLTARASRRCVLALIASQVGLALLGSPLVAATDEPQVVESQTRQFAVSVDGKKRGTVTMQMQHRNDGTDRMHCESTTIINLIVYKYTYTSSGTELWKNGRLIEMENMADYNGTRYSVKGTANARTLQVTADDGAYELPAEAWTSSYWQIPEHFTKDVSPARGASTSGPRKVYLLDSDQGRRLSGTLRWVGEETIAGAGQQRTCTHYQITGDVQVDLWYDSSRRLVRQQSVEGRHKIILELAGLSAE